MLLTDRQFLTSENVQIVTQIRVSYDANHAL